MTSLYSKSLKVYETWEKLSGHFPDMHFTDVGDLENTVPWISYAQGERLSLDGEFTTEQLRLLAQWAEFWDNYK